jgi:hypothetical protein
MRDGHEVLRAEMRALNEETRAEMRALNAETVRAMEGLHVQTLQAVDRLVADTRTHALVLHEEVIDRISKIEEGRVTRKRR